MPASWSGPVQTLNHFIATLPLLMWRADRDGSWLWASPSWQRFTGQDEADYVGDGWLDAVHPDDRPAAQRAWRDAIDDRAFEVEFRVLHVAEDRYVWFKTRAGPVFDDQQSILEWLGTSTDIDDLKRLREHERDLLAELQHRVRNVLGVVRVLARRTAGHSETLDDFVMRFEGRLNTLARTQTLSTRTIDGHVDLREMIFDELLVHHLQDERKMSIEGPSVNLSVKAAYALGLAIHELASHAVIHGGLREGNGQLEVAWWLETHERQQNLRLRWSEFCTDVSSSDIPLLPLERELFEEALKYELDAHTSLETAPGRLLYEFSLPLKGAQAGGS